jgi:hypothetical protein
MPWRDRFEKLVIYKKKPSDQYKEFFDDYQLEEQGCTVVQREIVFPEGTE